MASFSYENYHHCHLQCYLKMRELFKALLDSLSLDSLARLSKNCENEDFYKKIVHQLGT